MPISLEHVSFTYMKGTPFEKTALHDVNPVSYTHLTLPTT